MATWSEFACSANQHPKSTVKKAHKPLRISWISPKTCLPCLIIIQSCYFDYRINKLFACSRCVICVLYSVLDVLRAQRSMGFFILITHKSTRSENPITWGNLHPWGPGANIRSKLLLNSDARSKTRERSTRKGLGLPTGEQGDGEYSPVNARKVTTNIDSFSISVTALIFFYVKYSSIFIVNLPSTRSADTAETTIICQLEINCLLTVSPKLDHLLLDVPENSRSNFVRISYLRRLQVVIKNEGI